MQQFVTPNQAAEIIGVGPDHIRALIGDHSIKATNIGRGKIARWRIERTEVESYMARHQRLNPTGRSRRRRSVLPKRYVR